MRWAAQGPQQLVRLLDTKRALEHDVTSLWAAAEHAERDAARLSEDLAEDVADAEELSKAAGIARQLIAAASGQQAPSSHDSGEEADPEHGRLALGGLREWKRRRDERAELDRQVAEARAETASAVQRLQQEIADRRSPSLRPPRTAHRERIAQARSLHSALRNECESKQRALASTREHLADLEERARVLMAVAEGHHGEGAGRRLYLQFQEATNLTDYRMEYERLAAKRTQTEGDEADLAERLSELEHDNAELRRQLDNSAAYTRELTRRYDERLRWAQLVAEPVTRIGLPERVSEPLLSAGIATIGDLTRTTAEELLALPGFGQQSLDGVRRVLGRRDLGLLDDAPARDPGSHL